MSPYKVSILLSTPIALILLAIISIAFRDEDWILGAVLIGSYFALFSFIGTVLIATFNERSDDRDVNELSSRLDDIHKSQQLANETSAMIESRLEAIESKLESADNDTEDEPNDSNHTTRDDS